MKGFTITEQDYILANKRASRRHEIEQHGKLISTRPTRTFNSKKTYSRKGYRPVLDE